MYSIRSVDRYEMWGPSDTIERLQYNNKDLDFSYNWLCKERKDHIKVEWIVKQLNKKRVSLRNLNKALVSLSISWKRVRYKMYEKYWIDLAKKENCPFKKKQYLDNIRIEKINRSFEKKAEKWKRLSSKIPVFDLSILEGWVKNTNHNVSKKHINYYNRIKKHRFIICND